MTLLINLSIIFTCPEWGLSGCFKNVCIYFILCTFYIPLCYMCLAMDCIVNEHNLITYQCWETGHWRLAMKYTARISAFLNLKVWSHVSQTLLWVQATWILLNLIKILHFCFVLDWFCFFCYRRSGIWPKILHSNKPPGDTHVLVRGSHFEW